MTKSFTAKQMHNAPGPVFRTADRDGSVQITHDHYKDRVFVLTSEDKSFLESIDKQFLSDENSVVLPPAERPIFKSSGVSKKLLREFNDAYSKQQTDRHG